MLKESQGFSNLKVTMNTSKDALPNCKIVDIGVNLAHKSFESNWKKIVEEAIDSGVERLILTGTSLEASCKCLDMCQTWYEERNSKNLYATVGVHPYEAHTWNDDTLKDLRTLLQHPFAKAVGECGLDYYKNPSCSKARIQQEKVLVAQLQLAIEFDMPLFLHERDAFEDFIGIIEKHILHDGQLLDEKQYSRTSLPRMLVHCFDGTLEQALSYIERGFYLGFTGIVCKKERGAHLRHVLPELPMSQLMIETDAPFLGFKGRKPSRPSDCVDVARKLSEVKRMPFSTICERTRLNSLRFFNIKEEE